MNKKIKIWKKTILMFIDSIAYGFGFDKEEGE